MSGPDRELEQLREEISALDRTLLDTLNRRLELVERVRGHKDAAGELQAPVERVEQGVIERRDLLAQLLQLAVRLAHGTLSPAPTATASRLAGGASGQTQPGS